jgi:hypothetical protein
VSARAGTGARAVLRAVPVSGWAVLAATYLVAVLVAVDAPAGLRVPAVVAWVLLAPGLPWARLLRLGDRGDTLAAALATSLAAAAIVGGLLALAGAWDAVTAFRLLAALTVAGVVGPAVRAALPVTATPGGGAR